MRIGTGFGRSRGHLHRGDVEDLAVVLEEPPRGETPDDLDGFVHPLAPAGPGDVEEVVVLGPGGCPHPEEEAITGEDGHRGGLLGHHDRMADGELHHEGHEPQCRGHRPQGRDEGEGLDEGLVLEELPGPVGVEGIGGVGLGRVGDGVGDDEGVVAGVLGRPGQGPVEGGVGHGLGVGETHGGPRSSGEGR